jgi:DnaJ domain
MALGPDPYAVLGVPRDASQDQIAQARRRLSREYHPDVNPAPDAAARFDEIQRAYHQLSEARPERDRGRDERPHDEQGRTRVMRDPGGGYGSATEASPGLFVQPTAVNFGQLTPKRPRADAKVTLAWTGAPPVRLESAPGSGWWANLGSQQTATSSIVFYLRAHAHAGTRNGRQQGEFTVIFDDTTLTVPLTADIQGEFPPGATPDFSPLLQPGPKGRWPALPAEMQAWLVVVLALVILVLVIATSR